MLRRFLAFEVNGSAEKGVKITASTGESRLTH